MATPPSLARQRILLAAEANLKRSGASALTLEVVARDAACAKGLVHYHYKTKTNLLCAALERLCDTREQRWVDALRADSSESWITRSWNLICEEVDDGVVRAEVSVLSESDQLTVRTVKGTSLRFRKMLATAIASLLVEKGLESTLPVEETAALLSAGIHGMGLELARGATAAQVEAGYAALWLGLLSNTRPARG